MPCQGCTPAFLKEQWYINGEEEAATEVLRNHGILPRFVKCPHCTADCVFNSSSGMWSCGGLHECVDRCSFSVSDVRGTWVENLSDLSRSKCLLFIERFVRKLEAGEDIAHELTIPYYSGLFLEDWCNEVCNYWTKRQFKRQIGGPEKAVEIGEVKVGMTRYRRGRPLREKWFFGAFERGTRKLYLCHVEERSKRSFWGIITQRVHRDSTIYSYNRCTWDNLRVLGFNHHLVKRSLQAMATAPSSSSQPDAHTDNIDGILQKFKSFVIRSGNHEYLYSQYLARFLFVQECQKRERFHRFLRVAARMSHHPNAVAESE